ncbi:MAG: beta-propeller domain-containing protein [Verrucomicrobiota bacterium]
MNIKTNPILKSLWGILAALTVALGLAPRPAQAISNEPYAAIESIQVEGTNIVVKARVSSLFKRVALETRSRLEGGNWSPLAVEPVETTTDPVVQVTFRFPASRNAEFLRVRGDMGEVLPAAFFKGTNSFAQTGGPSTRGVEDSLAPGAAPTDSGSNQSTREVVESDIWKVQGDTLYFYNQYRGLQIIDIANPDQPVITGSYPLAAAGEQMYLVGTNQVVLLARDLCGNWNGEVPSAAILLEIIDGAPRKVGEVPIEGLVQESRMVGTALYVVANRYRPVPPKDGSTATTWEWGLQISSFDLSRFAEPQARFSAWIPGYGNAVYATPNYLFVSSPYRNGLSIADGKHDVHLFDISAEDGTMQALAVLQVPGRVIDKFKMNVNGETFTVVTESALNTTTTQVDTYSLADPKHPVHLGELKIIERERLFATRFDGALLYAVTFLRIDPLWVIDLSNPTVPKKVGVLEIPGWSTYIHPLGDRLVTIGYDNTGGWWRTAVQLFDVHDPAKPALLSKVVLGDQYSSSEGNYDEKAFGVLPDENLLLVPFSSSGTNGYFQGVQLIDLERDTLLKRGAVPQYFGARRATVHRDRILSISGREVLSVDATDRDQPKIISQTELSWQVEQVILYGDYLLELSPNWSGPSSIRVVLAESPSTVAKLVSLSDESLLGAVVRGTRLYLLQGKSTQLTWPEVYNPTNWAPLATNHATLRLGVYDLATLPELSLIGGTNYTVTTNRYWYGKYDALWPKEGTLAWSLQGNNYNPWYWRWGPTLAVDAGVGSLAPDIGMPIWWGGQGNHYLAFDVKESAQPKLVSDLSLQPATNQWWWNFSESIQVGALVYTSHETSEYLPDIIPPPQVYQQWNGTNYIWVTNQPPPGVWVQRHYLDVIDFTDAQEPTVRKPVNVPGTLVGVAYGGELLYTQSYQSEVNPWRWSEWIEASAYDGTQAHFVDAMPLVKDWPRAVHAYKGNLYISRPANTNETKAVLEVWTLPLTGKFSMISRTSLDSPPYSLETFGNLLAAQGNRIDLYDISNPAALTFLGGTGGAGCVGYNLDFADGSVTRGLWVPAGVYGVIKIDLKRN